MSDEIIKIPVNKKRFPMLFVVGIAFTFITVLILRSGVISSYYDDVTGRIMDSLVLIIPLFYTSAGLIDFLKTQFDDDAGFYITPAGINDNISIVSCGKIAWNEIAGVEVIKVLNTSVLRINLVNPVEVIKRQPFLKRRMFMRTAQRGKSPIVISEKRIEYDIFALKNIIASRLAQ